MGDLAIVLLILASMCILQAIAAEEQPVPHSAVPDDGIIRLVDYGYRNWGPELVQYTVDPKVFKPGEVVLRNAAGAEVPCQIDGGVLSFVATLAKGKTTRSPTPMSTPAAPAYIWATITWPSTAPAP